MTDRHAEQELLDRVPDGLWVGGAWRSARSGATFAVDDPATGDPLGIEVADASPAEGLEALDAAVDAAASWAATAPRVRSEILRRSFELLTARGDDFALLMTLEMGKPLAESLAEVRYGAEFFRWFSEEAVRIDGRFTTAPGGDGEIIVRSRPVGPCLLVTPWNFPLAMATRKIGPAVAAGCTMVLKPAEETPLTALLLVDVLREAGLPDGVLNLVTTSDPGGLVSALMADARLRKVSFTGSTPVGRVIRRQAAEHLQRVSLELGGSAPFLVFEDADLDAAVDGAVAAKMRNTGEACTSANRFLVHESLVAPFVDAFTARLSAMKMGRGTEADVQVGPLITAGARARVEGLVTDALGRDARLHTGGETPDGEGWFYPPTVLSDVPADAVMLHEEIFGPVAPVVSFTTDDEAVTMANATEYGLVSYCYTRDLRRAMEVSDALETGMVGVNRGVVSNPAAPFGGVKASGLGREGGAEGIWEYRDVKYVGIAG